MDKLHVALNVLGVGIGISVVFYWAGVLLGKLSTQSHELRWWARIAVPQGVLLALALKIFKVF